LVWAVPLEGDALVRLGDAKGETETGDVGCFAFVLDDGDLFSPALASRAENGTSRFGSRAGLRFAFASAAPYTFPWRELATSGAAVVLMPARARAGGSPLSKREPGGFAGDRRGLGDFFGAGAFLSAGFSGENANSEARDSSSAAATLSATGARAGTPAARMASSVARASVSGEMGMGVSSPKSLAEGRGDNAEWLTPPFFSNGPGRPAKRGVPSVVAF
jgi:hypothetical protein